MRLLLATMHRRMPWKNGGGETTEIIVSPKHAGLEDFDWRISMAKVGTDGPFSAFAGIDRTLSVIEGEGIALSVAGEPEIVLTTQSQPFGFPGDVAASARLIAGSITDLNVMTRRTAWCHETKRLRLSERQALRCAADVTLILSRSRDLGLVAEAQHCKLGIDDALVLEGPAYLELAPEGEATLFVVELERVV
ncbi:hypothetical protein SAMN05519104_3528 [Rhizobiales bacterium GAS188]|nr:hypothetical protein SAMN05519104_3528 [Rhizobiales bacterium GAS188]